jgi:hypothetical protein
VSSTRLPLCRWLACHCVVSRDRLTWWRVCHCVELENIPVGGAAASLFSSLIEAPEQANLARDVHRPDCRASVDPQIRRQRVEGRPGGKIFAIDIIDQPQQNQLARGRQLWVFKFPYPLPTVVAILVYAAVEGGAGPAFLPGRPSPISRRSTAANSSRLSRGALGHL